MPNYTALPSKVKFKTDLGMRISGSFNPVGNQKSDYPAIIRIGKLLDEAESYGVQPQDNERDAYALLLFYIYLDCAYFRKMAVKDTAEKKLGGTPDAQHIQTVYALEQYVDGFLRTHIGVGRFVSPADFQRRLMETYGREVQGNNSVMDQRLVQGGLIQWYLSDAARKQFKLSFRNGLAMMKNLVGDKITYTPYDTVAANDAIEFGGSLYVMDTRGRFYVSGKSGVQGTQFVADLKHSSLMGGERVMMAGTICFKSGKLKWISGKSGHYQPTVRQMVHALERLMVYNADLSGVTVYRENFRTKQASIPDVTFEGCKANDLLKARRWPTTVEPDSLHVAKLPGVVVAH